MHPVSTTGTTQLRWTVGLFKLNTFYFLEQKVAILCAFFSNLIWIKFGLGIHWSEYEKHVISQHSKFKPRKRQLKPKLSPKVD